MHDFAAAASTSHFIPLSHEFSVSYPAPTRPTRYPAFYKFSSILQHPATRQVSWVEDDEVLSLPPGPWRDVNGLHEAGPQGCALGFNDVSIIFNNMCQHVSYFTVVSSRKVRNQTSFRMNL